MSTRMAFLAALLIGLGLAMPAANASTDAGTCTYAGTVTPSGLMSYAFGGTAVAGSITCTLVSPAQGLPGEQPELRAEVGCNSGPACAVPVGVAENWPMRPVLICTSGNGIEPSCRASSL